MSRKQYKPPGSTHEKKVTRKERKRQLAEDRANKEQLAPAEEVIPTEEDTDQMKHLALYSVVGILILLAIMYYVFITSS